MDKIKTNIESLAVFVKKYFFNMYSYKSGIYSRNNFLKFQSKSITRFFFIDLFRKISNRISFNLKNLSKLYTNTFESILFNLVSFLFNPQNEKV